MASETILHAGKNEILITLILVPRRTFENNKAILQFVYTVATASAFTTRVDAMLVLGRLAKGGNVKAVELLNAALQDNNESVRNNAKICLDQLEEDA